jgi:16S rRNA (guanine(966)-N(2))-methyltransferase RsmD
MIRIGGGDHRGRQLRTPAGGATRPTSGMVRETLANILMADIPEARVLDLYAGCGSVGLELLSRGATAATFVESAKAALDCLHANIALLGVAGQADVLPLPAARALTHLAQAGAPFDIIFLDPPFADEPAYTETLSAVAAGHLLAEDGVLIAQHAARLHLPETLDDLTRTRIKVIGNDNALTFYRR